MRVSGDLVISEKVLLAAAVLMSTAKGRASHVFSVSSSSSRSFD